MNQTIYPIGIQNFEKIRKDGYLYIDKTALIYQLAKTGSLEVTNSIAAKRLAPRVSCYLRWRPISKGRGSCSRGWRWNGWRKTGRYIRSCIWT